MKMSDSRIWTEGMFVKELTELSVGARSAPSVAALLFQQLGHGCLDRLSSAKCASALATASIVASVTIAGVPGRL